MERGCHKEYRMMISSQNILEISDGKNNQNTDHETWKTWTEIGSCFIGFIPVGFLRFRAKIMPKIQRKRQAGATMTQTGSK